MPAKRFFEACLEPPDLVALVTRKEAQPSGGPSCVGWRGVPGRGVR